MKKMFDQQYCIECGEPLNDADIDGTCQACLTIFLDTAEGDRDYKCEPADTEEDWKLIQVK